MIERLLIQDKVLVPYGRDYKIVDVYYEIIYFPLKSIPGEIYNLRRIMAIENLKNYQARLESNTMNFIYNAKN